VADMLPPDFDILLDIGGYSRINGKQNGRGRSLRQLEMTWGVHSGQYVEGERRRLRTTLNSPTAEYDNERISDLKGDACALDIDDKKFFTVTCVDTIEHIPPEGRRSALQEMIRVSRNRVIVVNPFHSDENELHEINLTELLIQNDLPVSPALLEHQKYGLPDLEGMDRAIHDSGVHYIKTFHSLRHVYHAYYKVQVELINELWDLGVTEAEAKEVVLTLSDIVSVLLNDLDYLANESNSRRVRYVIKPESVPCVSRANESNRPPDIQRYFVLIPQDRHAQLIWKYFSKIYQESMNA